MVRSGLFLLRIGGGLGPILFAISIFALSLFTALVSGTLFGLLFGSVFREPATSLNMAVGFVVLLGMLSLCGLRGDQKEKVDAHFVPLHDLETVHAKISHENFTSNAPAAKISYILPQRYFFNIGRVTFNTEWSKDKSVQDALRAKFTNEVVTSDSLAKDPLQFKANWVQAMDDVNFDTNSGVIKWINYFSEKNLSETDLKCFKDLNQPDACEMVCFLRNHPEHRKGWKVTLHRKLLLTTIGIEILPLLLINVLCFGGTLLSVWKKGCYQQLR